MQTMTMTMTAKLRMNSVYGMNVPHKNDIIPWIWLRGIALCCCCDCRWYVESIKRSFLLSVSSHLFPFISLFFFIIFFFHFARIFPKSFPLFYSLLQNDSKIKTIFLHIIQRECLYSGWCLSFYMSHRRNILSFTTKLCVVCVFLCILLWVKMYVKSLLLATLNSK